MYEFFPVMKCKGARHRTTTKGELQVDAIFRLGCWVGAAMDSGIQVTYAAVVRRHSKTGQESVAATFIDSSNALEAETNGAATQ